MLACSGLQGKGNLENEVDMAYSAGNFDPLPSTKLRSWLSNPRQCELQYVTPRPERD